MGLHAQRQLAAGDGGLQQKGVAERRRDLVQELAQGFFALGEGRDGHGFPALGLGGDRRPQRSIVPVRWILRCSKRIPYTSASAVGGQPGT